jgi:N-acetylglucosaminyldiphosphoundecaprenol N-acetyl-beta-D-mannosaminyltransferase
MERINLLGVPVDNMTMIETLDAVKHAIDNNKHIHHTVVNAGKIVLMSKNEELYKSVTSADIINVDGAGVVLASRFLNNPLKERVAGIDLMTSIIKMAAEHQLKIYLLGATDEVLKKMTDKLDATYGPGLIAGSRNGYFSDKEEKAVAEQIAASGAQILFVAMPSPKKENFLFRYESILQKVNFTMGVGGSFDVVAGKVQRAPVWMQKNSLEWAYRVYQEPKRMFMRYLKGNLQFIGLVMKFKMGYQPS